MNILVTIPPVPRAIEQSAMLAQVFAQHEIHIATTREQQAQGLPEADILLSTAFVPVSRSDIAAAKRLKFIQVLGVGVDHVDVDAVRDGHLLLADVTGANSVSVAEHVMLSMFALYRPLVDCHNQIAAGSWPLARWMGEAEDLEGKTVGVIGMGRIGRELAKRLLPFGVGIVYYDLRRLAEPEEDQLGITYLEKDELLAVSDVVTLHLPYTAATHHFLARRELLAMKPGSVLVNAARAQLVCTEDLVEALQGHLRGAAIDVFASEPPAPDSPLLSLPNVLLTPHGGGTTLQAQNRIAQQAIQNVLRYLDGRSVQSPVVEVESS